MKEWNIVDAQDHLEDVMQDALQTGPQRIDLMFGRGAVVVLSAAVYERLVETRTEHPAAGGPASNLLEFLQNSPIAEAIRAGEMAEDWLERDRAAERRALAGGFT